MEETHECGDSNKEAAMLTCMWYTHCVFHTVNVHYTLNV